MALERQPKVFREGRFATTVENAAEAANKLFENGALFDIKLEPEPTEVSVNPVGRGEYVYRSETTVLEEIEEGYPNAVMVTGFFAPPDYIPAKILEDDVNGDLTVNMKWWDEDTEETTINLEVFAVDDEALQEDLKFVIQGVLAAGYMAGRRDQILDLFASNEPRFVKSDDLGPVVDAASNIVQPEYGFFSDFSAERQTTINALRSLIGALKGNGIAKPDLAMHKFDNSNENRHMETE